MRKFIVKKECVLCERKTMLWSVDSVFVHAIAAFHRNGREDLGGDELESGEHHQERVNVMSFRRPKGGRISKT